MSRDTNTRRIEQLVALLHYEIAGTDSARCAASEQVEFLIEHARKLVLDPDLYDDGRDLTHEDCDKIARAAITFAPYVLRGLIAAVGIDAAEKWIETEAADRRRCDARFGGQRDIPLTREESERLAKEWDAAKAASEAAS